MTVSELIEKLKLMPQDAKVLLTAELKGNWDEEVRDIVYNSNALKENNARWRHTVELDNWPPSEELFSKPIQFIKSDEC
jgi:hypothetical protein